MSFVSFRDTFIFPSSVLIRVPLSASAAAVESAVAAAAAAAVAITVAPTPTHSKALSVQRFLFCLFLLQQQQQQQTRTYSDSNSNSNNYNYNNMPPHMLEFEQPDTNTIQEEADDIVSLGSTNTSRQHQHQHQQQAPKPRKSVEFAANNTVHFIAHFREYSPDEQSNIWMSRQELYAVRRSCIQAVHEFDQQYTHTQTTDTDQQDNKMRVHSDSDSNSDSDDTADNDDNDNHNDIRGLESYTRPNLERSKAARSTAREAVFGMQKFQKFNGSRMPDLMAEVYANTCVVSLKLAQSMAEKDAQQAITCR